MHLPYNGHVLGNGHIAVKNNVCCLEEIIFWHMWEKWKDSKCGTKNIEIISEINNYGYNQISNVIKTD